MGTPPGSQLSERTVHPEAEAVRFRPRPSPGTDGVREGILFSTCPVQVFTRVTFLCSPSLLGGGFLFSKEETEAGSLSISPEEAGHRGFLFIGSFCLKGLLSPDRSFLLLPGT